jgi:hypothetical protein
MKSLFSLHLGSYNITIIAVRYQKIGMAIGKTLACKLYNKYFFKVNKNIMILRIFDVVCDKF